MRLSDEELLRYELNFTAAADAARRYHRTSPRMPPGHRFILWVMLLIWLLLGAATMSAWGTAKDLSAVALLVVLGIEGIVAAAVAGWIWQAIGPRARAVLRPLLYYWYLTIPALLIAIGYLAAPFLLHQEMQKRRAHGATEEEAQAGIAGATTGASWRILTAANHTYIATSQSEAAQACQAFAGHLPDQREAVAVVPELQVPQDSKFWLAAPVPEANNAPAFVVTRERHQDTTQFALYGGQLDLAGVLCIVGPVAAASSPASNTATTAPTAAAAAALPPVALDPVSIARSLGQADDPARQQLTDQLARAAQSGHTVFVQLGRIGAQCDENRVLRTVEAQLHCRAQLEQLEQALATVAGQRTEQLRIELDSAKLDDERTFAGLVYGLALGRAPLAPDHPAVVKLMRSADRDLARLAELAVWRWAKNDPRAARVHARRLGVVNDMPSLRLTHALAAATAAPEACRLLGGIAASPSSLTMPTSLTLRDLPDPCARLAAGAMVDALRKKKATPLIFFSTQLAALGAAGGSALRGLLPSAKSLSNDEAIRIGSTWTDLVRQQQLRQLGVTDDNRLRLAARTEPNLQLSTRACTAADFGLARGAALPFAADICFAAAAGAPFPKNVPVFRPI